jgi:hypothetical protein
MNTSGPLTQSTLKPASKSLVGWRASHNAKRKSLLDTLTRDEIFKTTNFAVRPFCSALRRQKYLLNPNRTCSGSTGWKTSVNAGAAVGVIRDS